MDAATKEFEQDIISTFEHVKLKALHIELRAADDDKDGELNLEEFTEAIKKAVRRTGWFTAGIADSKVASVFKALDTNNDSKISIDEFMAPRAVAELTCTLPSQPTSVIRPYMPGARQLWGRWEGTIIATTFVPTMVSCVAGILLTIVLRTFGNPTWPLGTLPDPKHPIISHMLPLATLWDKHVALSTFVVTFFVGQAYTFWRHCYNGARHISCRISDLNLLLAISAKRGADGKFTPDALKFMKDTARNSRLFHMLYWTSVMPRYNSMSAEPGLKLLCELGHCTPNEMKNLLAKPQKHRHHAAFMWLIAKGPKSQAEGVLAESLAEEGFQQNWNDRATALRSQYGSIAHALEARMPMVYLHLVQILVDSLIIMSPFALFARLGATSFMLNGLVTTFYRGLVDVCKSFLDPFGTVKTDVPIQVPVLVEHQIHASTRYLEGGDVIPED